MSALALAFAILLPGQATFTEFSFCREGPRQGDPVECILLDGAGEGSFVVRYDDDEDSEPLVLSETARTRLQDLLGETDYLREGSEYESGRSVANLGRKTMAIEGSWGRREAAFNYSARGEVNQLLTFLDRLIAQENLIVGLDFSLEFDRLSLATTLERVQDELRQDRFPDPVRLLEVLRRIESDARVLNLARSHARRLIEDIEGD